MLQEHGAYPVVSKKRAQCECQPRVAATLPTVENNRKLVLINQRETWIGG
jgi:hypothetical protein